MAVDEDVPCHDRKSRIVVRQQQAGSEIEAEDRRADDGDEREPTREPARSSKLLSACPASAQAGHVQAQESCGT
jgi:hypothetical protein